MSTRALPDEYDDLFEKLNQLEALLGLHDRRGVVKKKTEDLDKVIAAWREIRKTTPAAQSPTKRCRCR